MDRKRPEPQLLCRRFLVEGRVQGVGFRRAGAEMARGLGLDGWIRNRGDRVEVLVQGSPEAVDAFARWLAQGPPWARVGCVKTWEEHPVSSGFCILPSVEEEDG